MVKTENKKTIPIFIRWFPLICLAILSSQPCYGQKCPNGNELALIADGNDALPGRFPYMCSIRQRGNRDHACGGMLIASKWVLTAAHCLDPADSRSTGRSPLIYCGIHHRQERDKTKTHGTTRCYLHHLWTGNVLDGSDIALCELDRASTLPIPDLPTAGDAFGRLDNFTVLGWGRTSNKSLSDELQIGSHIKFVSDSTCNNTEGWRGRLKEPMICAGFDDPYTCRGDSGGPLLIPDKDKDSVVCGDPSRDLIVGITSFGDPLCEKAIPTVYTRVSCYRTWINCIIGGTAKDCSVHVPCEEPPLGCSGGAKSARFNETDAIQTIRTAIKTDDAATVETVVCEGLNPNTTLGFLEDSLLQFAARYNALKSAKVLLRHGAAVDGDGFISRFFSYFFSSGTPLSVAATSGAARLAEVLIKKGANINANHSLYDRTPLMCAVVAKKLNTVEVLLRFGADLKIRDSSGYTALHLAAKGNVPKIAKALIDAEADIENAIPYRPSFFFRVTALSQLANLFFAPQSFVLASATSVDSEDDGGWTALHVTARYNCSDVAKVLLDAGAEIEGKTVRGSSPLHIAAMSKAYDVAKILIDGGADAKSKDKSEWTPLHFAAQRNSLKIAEALEEAGADKEGKTTSGYDPLMIASRHGSLSVVKFLLERSVSLNSEDEDGETALHLAASRGHVSVVEALVENGTSKLTTNNKGETPFDAICSRLPESECPSQTKTTLQGLLRID